MRGPSSILAAQHVLGTSEAGGGDVQRTASPSDRDHDRHHIDARRALHRTTAVALL